MLMKFMFNTRLFYSLLVNSCLIILLSGNLFAQETDAKRIGVCNVASKAKPIELESTSPNLSIAYPNLSEAFFAINQGKHTGEINVEVCFDSVEREAAILNSQETDLANYSKVTIRPLKDDITISAKTGYNAFVALKGTDNVTIDGDNPNSFGINRDLTIKGWGGSSVIAIQTRFHSRKEYDSANNNTLKNLNIFANSSPSYGIAIGGHNPGSNGDSNNNNSIINCAFQRVRTGIFSGGKSSRKPNIGTIISKNDLSTTGENRVRLVGIKLEYESKAVVTENRIGGLKSHKGEIQAQVGIRLGGGKMSYMAKRCEIRCYRSVSNSLIARNIINGIIGGDRQSVAGIYIYGYKTAISEIKSDVVSNIIFGSESGANRVQNNVVSGIIGSNKKSNVLAGIFVAGQVGSKTLLYNNSISMTGEYGSDEIHNPSYALVIWGEDISISLFNNIFANIQTAQNNPWAKSYVVGFVTKSSDKKELPFALIKSNNNLFYSSGNNKGFIRMGSLKRREGTEINNLKDWQKTSASDLNSLAKKPLFVSSVDNLSLQKKSPAINSGVSIKDIKEDVIGTKRLSKIKTKDLLWKQKTDIGAYEWKPEKSLK